MFNSKSIAAKLIRAISIMLAIVCVGMAITGYFISKDSLTKEMEEDLMSTAESLAGQANEMINGYFNILVTISASDSFLHISDKSNMDEYLINRQRICEFLNAVMEKNPSIININIADVNGDAFNQDDQDLSIADRPHFQSAVKGQRAVSSPTIGKTTGKLSVMYTIPLTDVNNRIIGVMSASTAVDSYSKVMANTLVFNTSHPYIIDKEGTKVAHSDFSLVEKQDNTIKNSEQDSKLAQLANSETKAIRERKGFSTYNYEGEKIYLAYAHVNDASNWTLVVPLAESALLRGAKSMMVSLIVLSVLFFIAGIITITIIAKNISRPIKDMSQICGLLSTCDFSQDVPSDFIKREDEIGTLANGFNTMISSVNKILCDVLKSTENVAAGSMNVSSVGQSLAQNTTEQASSVEQLFATIIEITDQTKQNTNDANEANNMAMIAKKDAETGNEYMKTLIGAMQNIDESSKNISRIIKIIDDISFQTNILALNATVEAARAGHHGKGFAVVAEEVRNLAEKSAKAAKETTAMIEVSVKNVREGNIIANDTANALNKIVEAVTNSSQLIERIVRSSSDQAGAINQVNQAVSQISQAVQANSATSEKSAATSIALSDQANSLKKLLGEFKLK